VCFICLALLKNVYGSKISLALLVCSSFLFLGFVAGFLDNKTEGLTKRLPKDYELVRIVQNKKVSGWIIRARLVVGKASPSVDGVV